MKETITINLQKVYKKVSGRTAKIADMDKYISEVLFIAGDGNLVELTGGAPIWMYLKIAHELHGRAKKLFYSAPGQKIKDFEIFSHDPF